MQKTVQNFLQKYADPSKPFLLALSGGPDSMALFHMLLQDKQNAKNFAIAHVDHGWRECSAIEAKMLQEMAQKLHIAFHLKRLDPLQLMGNLESACRTERLKFFKSLCLEHGYQAVMLGHHADDQAETVMKKLFEGVALPYIGNLKAKTSIDGLTLWRPLLSVRKHVLVKWLAESKVKVFDDITNQDERFLRARFRRRLFPLLAQEFGKEITLSLCDIAKESAELNAHLRKRVQNFLAAIYQGPLGFSLDLSKDMPEDIVELKFLLRHFCAEAHFTLSKAALETLAHLLISGKANKSIVSAKKALYIDRKRLFLPYQDAKWEAKALALTVGKLSLPGWHVELREESPLGKVLASDWQQAWQGQSFVYLPFGHYDLLPPPRPKELFPRNSTMGIWWNNHKVPAFMRYQLPVICQENKIIHEFLSGKCQFLFPKADKVLKLLLKVNN